MPPLGFRRWAGRSRFRTILTGAWPEAAWWCCWSWDSAFAVRAALCSRLKTASLQLHFCPRTPPTHRGLYLHEVWPGLLCGTQPRSPDEVAQLAGRHGVVAMINLQQDKDMSHWG